MKTRRTFLKLFVMACFLAVLWSGNAKAASPTTLNMNTRDIYISNDRTGYGNPDTDSDHFTDVSSDIADGYIITGSTSGGGHNIIINLKDNTNLNLTFRSLEMALSSHIEIRGVNTNIQIRLEGISSITSGDSPAISQ